MNGMSIIVKTVTRLVLGFIVVFAAVTLVYGHLMPGGGFAGGIMLACAFILVMLAYGGGEAMRLLRQGMMRSWDAFGALALAELVFIGMLGGYALSRHVPHGTPFNLLSGGTIMWSNLIVGIKVMVFIAAVFWALAVFRVSGENR